MHFFQIFLVLNYNYITNFYEKTLENTWVNSNITLWGSTVGFQDNYLINLNNNTLGIHDFYNRNITSLRYNIENVSFAKTDILHRRILISTLDDMSHVVKFNTSAYDSFAFVNLTNYTLTNDRVCLTGERIYVVNEGGGVDVFTLNYQKMTYEFDIEIYTYRNDATTLKCNEHFGVIQNKNGVYTMFEYIGDDIKVGPELYSGGTSHYAINSHTVVLGDPPTGEVKMWDYFDGDLVFKYTTTVEKDFTTISIDSSGLTVGLGFDSGDFVIYGDFTVITSNKCIIAIIATVSSISFVIICVGFYLWNNKKKKEIENTKKDVELANN